jgi:hypothetical protein
MVLVTSNIGRARLGELGVEIKENSDEQLFVLCLQAAPVT